MVRSPNWTEAELSILKEAYPKIGGCKELQDLLPNRGLEAICLKANRIGLKVVNNIRVGRTDEWYVKELLNTNFVSMEKYKGSTTPIKHRCKICLHEWLTRPQHALKEGANCPICDLKLRTNNIEYIDSILDKAEMLRHSEYRGSLKPLLLEHLNCGYMWETKFSYIQQGSGCPLCNRGFGHSLSKESMPSKAKLYLLEVVAGGERFLKVGVTVRPTSKRINEFKSRFEEVYPTVLLLAELESAGIEVLKKEQYLLSKYTKYESKLYFEGRTELIDYSDKELILKEFYE
jgi:predicted Zn-ribbon and HTH transcriptional regulator